eukprot:COSAG01_NODE_1519_length_10043_cov_9.991854_4_plen_394_part_00
MTLVGTQGEAAPSPALDERLSLAGSGLCDADVQGLATTLQAPEWQGLTALDLSANRLTDRARQEKPGGRPNSAAAMIAAAAAGPAAAGASYAQAARAGTSRSRPWGVLPREAFTQAECERCFDTKVESLCQRAVASGLVRAEVCAVAQRRRSAARHHRDRAQFAVVEEGEGGRRRRRLVQFDGHSRQRVEVSCDALPVLSIPNLAALECVLRRCRQPAPSAPPPHAEQGLRPAPAPEPEPEPELPQSGSGGDVGEGELDPLLVRLAGVQLHSTLSGQVCVTLVYRRAWPRERRSAKGQGRTVAPPPPGVDGWRRAAAQLRREISLRLGRADQLLIGDAGGGVVEDVEELRPPPPPLRHRHRRRRRRAAGDRNRGALAGPHRHAGRLHGRRRRR